ncbi:MAG: hypothetical protein ACLU6B_06365 [Lachnospirales bacterium]
MKNLSELQQDMYQERQIENRIRTLEKRCNQLEDTVSDLKFAKEKEEEDVEKMQGRSLAVLFHKILGKQQEMLDKEQLEAYEAAVKYDAAVRELEAVKQSLNALRDEKMELQGSEDRYKRALRERIDELRRQKDTGGEKMTQIQEHKGELRKQQREVEEAEAAGRSALSIAESILDSLDSAKSWSTWDLIGGGGLVSDLVKHGHLDEAQDKVEDLQIALSRFHTELMDVEIPASFDVRVDGFLKFADFFFDGLLADWMVRDRIQGSREQVEEARRSIEKIMDQLRSIGHQIEGELQRLEAQIEEMALQQEEPNHA